MSEGQPSKRRVFHVIAGPVLAFISYVAVSTLATMAYYLINVILTVVRPEIIAFFAGVAGGVVGVIAAKGACERWLPDYSPRAVFVVFAIVLGGLLLLNVILLPITWTRLGLYVQLAASLWLAYSAFWLDHFD